MNIMKQFYCVVYIALLISIVFVELVNATADRFIFPVLSDNHSLVQNNDDPRDYGWFVGNGFGDGYQNNPVCTHEPKHIYHPGEDWNRKDGRDNNGNEPVYSIGNGVIARIERNNNFYGGTILIRYELREKMNFTPYFLPNTTPVNLYVQGKYIIVQYMHIKVDSNLRVGQEVSLGQKLGKIINIYNGIVFRHLHFEIMVDPNGNSFASTARNNIGYYENQQTITNNGYINPTRFILGYNASQSTTNFVARYPNGTINQAILTKYQEMNVNGKGGIPFDNTSGTAYVHEWPKPEHRQAGDSYVVIQDFKDSEYGTDGQYAIIYNSNTGKI